MAVLGSHHDGFQDTLEHAAQEATLLGLLRHVHRRSYDLATLPIPANKLPTHVVQNSEGPARVMKKCSTSSKHSTHARKLIVSPRNNSTAERSWKGVGHHGNEDEDAEGKDEDAEGKDEDAEGEDEDAEGKDEDAEGKDEDAEGKDEDAEGEDEDAEGGDEDEDEEKA
ncbi:hypothetical protein MJO28_013883 [Puccinia striiformis f. sp. tritici]|uniref:Uncharacterized protein n=1 Tax=Puccinia striiformis f. sp. tritici TaxID=168172 RepID=A0ACC0DW15_9BASI|nr:hypothetical protein MJO28_013883 [Puccinia striiformis f. sp. tritici]